MGISLAYIVFSFFKAIRSLGEHEERLDKLEAFQKSAVLDWDELYDKCRHLMGRVAKERARMEALQVPSQEEPDAATDGANGSSFLTPHQRKIQRQIMIRRGGG